MTRKQTLYGTLAIEPWYGGGMSEIVSLDRYRAACGKQRTVVEETLDDFEGEPLARTKDDRRFAAIAGAVACFALFFFSFAPII